TGIRDAALASLKIKHIDLKNSSVNQDPREVKTKNSKAITVTFFPVGGAAAAIVADWIEFLVGERLWGPDDPLFPATCIQQGPDFLFRRAGVSRNHWSNAGPIRKIFKQAFTNAGLPAFNPHSFRNALTMLGQQICKTPEDFKAWSQNLGHEQVLT